MRSLTNNLLIIIATLLGLLLAAGCDQGEDPAEAMLRASGSRTPGGAGGRSSGAQTETPAGGGGGLLAEGGAAAGGAADAANPCNPCNPCETVEEEYTGPKVEITVESVENGIPEYTGKAKYDIRLEVQSDEVPATPSIWVIRAFDEEGELVGETKKHLTIPSSYPKTIALSGFYCSNWPTSFQVRRTEGEGLSIEESQAGGSSSSSGGGGKKGGGGAVGRGTGDVGGDDEDFGGDE
ncbi:hypothetical protein KDL44_00100 [bacterium]|nr:hypothetical protein [bacterium]